MRADSDAILPPNKGSPAPRAAEPVLPLRLLLSFSNAAFERRFSEHYVSFYRPYAQAALLLGLLLILGDFAIDWFGDPHLASNWLRLQTAVPVLIAGLAYTFLPQARRHWQPALAGFIVTASCCLFWILLQLDAEGGAGLSSWVGILNFTFLEFYCFVILGVQFRVALFAGLLILMTFEATLWLRPDLSGIEIAYWSYHVITLFILAAGMGWWREYVLRKDFATRADLDQERQEAERLARTKSEFLATMSHEIRTPLNGVLGMNELLMDSALTDEQRAWSEAVQASGRHLLALLNDVLDVSKIEAGHLTLERVDFDLRQVIEDTRLMFAQPAHAKGIELSAEFAPPNADLLLRGDPLRLRQLIANLIGNAVKFTSKGHVRVHVEQLARSAEAAQVRICVADSGVGIPIEAQANIFDEFSQADGSTTRRYGGTGLGLAICRKLTSLMGGTIEVDSAPGEGARFIVELGLPLATRSAVPQSADAAATRLRGKVLVVEDHPVNQSVASGMLRKLGLEWQIADNGALALERVREEDFDLVLMDCQMPVMDGYEATRAIRALPHRRGEQLPIVALSANSSAQDSERCRQAGMDGFVSKPFTLAALRAGVAPWLAAADETIDNLSHAAAQANPVHVTSAAPSGAAISDAAIDPTAIDTLFELDEAGGPGLLREVVAGFLDSADARLEQAHQAIVDNAAQVLRQTAHAMKSSSFNVGAKELAKHYGELERCADRGELQRAGEWLERTRREQGRVVAELDSILSALA